MNLENKFLIKYLNDLNFRKFINQLIDLDSELYLIYKIEKSYELLIKNIDIISKNFKDYKFMLDKIDIMIEYFKKNEYYEKCQKLIEIKNILNKEK